MPRISITLTSGPVEEPISDETFEVDVEVVPRIGDHLYLDEAQSREQVGQWKVILVRHNYNYYARNRAWSAADQSIDVFIRRYEGRLEA